MPQRPGPFTWQSACEPVGREHFIPLRGANTIRVVWKGTAQAQGDEEQTPTDLQLINQAFVRALDHQMDALPLSPGTRLFLQAEDHENEASWVVEDALIETLQRRGYQVLVRQPADVPADVFYYRLVRARVVYSPTPRRLLLSGNQHRREAYGDLFLRIETTADRIVRWDRRVQAYSSDMVPKGLHEVLGGGRHGRTNGAQTRKQGHRTRPIGRHSRRVVLHLLLFVIFKTSRCAQGPALGAVRAGGMCSAGPRPR